MGSSYDLRTKSKQKKKKKNTPHKRLEILTLGGVAYSWNKRFDVSDSLIEGASIFIFPERVGVSLTGL